MRPHMFIQGELACKTQLVGRRQGGGGGGDDDDDGSSSGAASEGSGGTRSDLTEGRSRSLAPRRVLNMTSL